MNWSDQHRVLWYTPIRTATRSVGYIMTHNNFECDLDGRVPNHAHFIPKGKEDYYYIANVRNPYTRLVSIYYLLNLHQLKDFNTNFETWLTRVIAIPNFIQYNAFCISDCTRKKPNKLIRVENLKEDILSLFFLNPDDESLQEIIKEKIEKNVFEKDFDFPKKYWKDFYNQKIANVVYSICQRDFINFGYDKNSWK